MRKRGRGNVVVATLPVDQINHLTERSDVVHVQMGETLKSPQPEREPSPSAPSLGQRKFGSDKNYIDARKSVMVGIIDVEGFDFAHPDFLNDDGGTRWVSIWDQGGSNRPHPGTTGCDCGSEILAEHMNIALKSVRAKSGSGITSYRT